MVPMHAQKRRGMSPVTIRFPKTLAAAALVLSACGAAQAQYAPPPPLQPFPGFLNDWMRKQDPYLANWDISGAARFRYELKENAGFTAPGSGADFRKGGVDNDNSYFMNKVLARVGYTAKWWSFLVEGRNSGTTGDDRNPNAESDGPVELHQAYFTLGNHKEFPLSLKVGRQELSYGDERLVGAFAWNNIGRVFDAAKARWQNSWFSIDAFTSRIVLPDDNNFNMGNDYNLFSGAYLTTKKIPRQTTEFYFFFRNDGPGSTTANPASFPPFQVPAPFARDIYTVGLRLKSSPGDFGNWDYTVESAGQLGNWKPTALSARQDHQAYMAAFNLGYTFPEAFGTPRLALEYAFGSGDSEAGDNKHETFDNLYPTNHKFYGYMDLLSLQNIHAVRPIFTIKPHPKVSVALEGNLFWLADTHDRAYNVAGLPRGGTVPTPGNGFGINPNYDSYLGSEIDLVAGFSVTKFAMIEAGYGHFFRGEYIKQTWSAIGSQDAGWFYLQTMVRF
jgi:Alginate export